MVRIPFDAYDFFGYLASGLVLVVGCEVLFGVPPVLNADLSLVQAALLILLIYAAGQAAATPARALLESVVVHRLLGDPNDNLCSLARPKRRFLFPGYYRPLPEPTRTRVLELAKNAGIAGRGQALFLHARFSQAVITNDRVMERLETFLSKYGFARNLSFAALIVGVAVIIKGSLEESLILVKYGWMAIGLAVLLLYRYLHFYRQYAFEVLNTFAGAAPPRPQSADRSPKG